MKSPPLYPCHIRSQIDRYLIRLSNKYWAVYLALNNIRAVFLAVFMLVALRTILHAPTFVYKMSIEMHYVFVSLVRVQSCNAFWYSSDLYTIIYSKKVGEEIVLTFHQRQALQQLFLKKIEPFDFL